VRLTLTPVERFIDGLRYEPVGRVTRHSEFVERVAAHPLADPVGHVAVALTRSSPVDPTVRFSQAGLEVLGRHGLLDAAAREGPVWLRQLALPIHARSTARRAVMGRHVDRLSERLLDNGVDSVLLKGRAAARFYPDPSIRPWSDIDLLVRPEDVEMTLKVLSDDPWVRDIPAQGPEADKRHIMMGEGDMYFVLDLHWHLFSYHQLRGRADVALPEIWASTTIQEGVRRLPLEAELAFFAAHAVLDHRFRLILFRDLAELTRSAPLDWDGLARALDRWGLRSVMWAALTCAEAFALAPVPAGFLDDLRVRSLSLRLFGNQVASIDPVRFDGHRPHLLNLASVFLHDDRSDRMILAVRAPLAYGGWRKKTEIELMRPRQRILILVTSNQRRGAEVFGESLAEHLRARDWDSTLMCLWEGDGPAVAAAPVTAGPAAPSRLSWRAAFRLARKMTQFDVVLANGSATLFHVFLASRMVLRRPAMVYSSIGEPVYWARSRLRRRIQRWVLSRFDLVTGVSEETRRQLIETIGLDRERVLHAPTGVAEMTVPGGSPVSPALRVAFIGSLTHEKRPDLMIDVLEELQSQHWSARIVGDGPLRGEVERRLAASDRLRDKVEVIGPLSSVVDVLSWATCLVQTSESEGLPGVVMEAAAAGRPAVAFDVGGTRELVHDGVTGRLVPFGDVTGMAAMLDELAGEPARAHEMGAKARELVVQEYTLDKAVDGYVAAFEKALESRRRGR
jgi:glycosyltransferase involved in cell wall biosynthesis